MIETFPLSVSSKGPVDRRKTALWELQRAPGRLQLHQPQPLSLRPEHHGAPQQEPRGPRPGPGVPPPRNPPRPGGTGPEPQRRRPRRPGPRPRYLQGLPGRPPAAGLRRHVLPHLRDAVDPHVRSGLLLLLPPSVGRRGRADRTPRHLQMLRPAQNRTPAPGAGLRRPPRCLLHLRPHLLGPLHARPPREAAHSVGGDGSVATSRGGAAPSGHPASRGHRRGTPARPSAATATAAAGVRSRRSGGVSAAGSTGGPPRCGGVAPHGGPPGLAHVPEREDHHGQHRGAGRPAAGKGVLPVHTHDEHHSLAVIHWLSFLQHLYNAVEMRTNVWNRGVPDVQPNVTTVCRI